MSHYRAMKHNIRSSFSLLFPLLCSYCSSVAVCCCMCSVVLFSCWCWCSVVTGQKYESSVVRTGNRFFFRNPSWVGISMQKQWRKRNATVVSFSYLLKARDSQINFSFPWKARMFVLPLNTGLKFHESSPMHYRSGLPLKPYFSWKGSIGAWRPLRHF